jgi:hypothetical protein
MVLTGVDLTHMAFEWFVMRLELGIGKNYNKGVSTDKMIWFTPLVVNHFQ